MRLIHSSLLALAFLIPDAAISAERNTVSVNYPVNLDVTAQEVTLNNTSDVTAQVRTDHKKVASSNAIAPKDSDVNKSSEMLVDFRDERINQYWRAAFTQLERGNWHKPSGSSAIEYYLNVNIMLKAKNPKNVEHIKISDEAISNLLPYIHNAAESAIDNNNRVEAVRLLRILELVDKDSRTLNRIKAKLSGNNQQAAPIQAPQSQVQQPPQTPQS